MDRRYLHTTEVTYIHTHKFQKQQKEEKNRRMADSFPACLVYVYDELVMFLAIEIQKYFLKVTEFYKHWTYIVYSTNGLFFCKM